MTEGKTSMLTIGRKVLLLTAVLLGVARADAAQVIVNNGDSGLAVRNAINGNFSDLYNNQGGRDQNGFVLTSDGDSRAPFGTYSSSAGAAFPANPALAGLGVNSDIFWATSWSAGALRYDPAMSYPGSPGALLRLIVGTAGVGCPASTAMTFTPGTPTGTPANAASAITVTADSSGNVPVGQIYVPANQGSGYVTNPGITRTDGGAACTTTPTFVWVFGGNNIGYGVPGDTTAGMLVRARYDIGVATLVPNTDPTQNVMCKAHPDGVVVEIGTNSITAGATLASMQSDLTAYIALRRQCGIRVVLESDSARAVGTGGWTAAMDQQRLAFNQFLESYARQSRFVGGGYSPVSFADTDHLAVDPSSSTGSVFTPYTYDTLHPGSGLGMIRGLAIREALIGAAPPIRTAAYSQSDVFSATNPGGNLLGTNSQCNATGGSGGSGSGTVCAGYTVLAPGSTTTLTTSIESPRTDGLPGKRQVIQTAAASGGATADRTRLQITIPLTNINRGTDSLVAGGTLDVSALSGSVYGLGCFLVENGPAQQVVYAGGGGAINVGTGYMLTSAQMALIDEAKTLPDFGKSGAGSYKLHWQTRWPLKTQASATNYYIECSASYNDNAAAAAVTMKVADTWARVVQSTQVAN